MPNDVDVDERTTKSVVTVNSAQGESLEIMIRAQGANPTFVFASKWGSTSATLRKSTDFPGHPKQQYDWNHVGPGQNPSGPQDTRALGTPESTTVHFTFLAVTQYDLLVSHRDANGAEIEVVKDITYKPKKPTASYDELLKIKWQ